MKRRGGGRLYLLDSEIAGVWYFFLVYVVQRFCESGPLGSLIIEWRFCDVYCPGGEVVVDEEEGRERAEKCLGLPSRVEVPCYYKCLVSVV